MMNQIFPGVFREGRFLYTLNAAPGFKVYGERLVKSECVEYRQWDPYRSKLAAAVLNGLKGMPVKPGDKVLYLGAAQGTTASHVSDVAGNSGYVVCVEISSKPFQKLMPLCEERGNMLPVLADANEPCDYEEYCENVNCIYQDVAQPNQGKILLKNARFLEAGDLATICVKARSINVAEEPRKVFERIEKELSKELKVVESLGLKPYDKDHRLVVCEKR
jgi:fibrillarin-like pre-rRNA processing protein